MDLTRREFLKYSGLAAGASALSYLGLPVKARAAEPLRIHYAREITTICAYCSGGCGLIVSVRDGEVVSLEGDPDHPVNEGSLCSKANSMINLRYVIDRDGKLSLNPNRLTKVLYRAPGKAEWEEKEWSWALEQIAARVKRTRDATFEATDAAGVTVNRTTGIAHFGSAAIDSEENYLMVKMQRALGLVNHDHHARL